MNLLIYNRRINNMMDLDLKISLDVKGSKYDGNIREVMKINENNLTDEFINQPSTYAWFATLAEIASSEVESKKFELDVLRANLDTKKRETLAKEHITVDDKGKEKGRVTEAMVTSAILTDERYAVLHQELLELTRQQGILKAIVRALEQRKDMLIQLGSTKRQEMVLSDFGVDLKKIRENK